MSIATADVLNEAIHLGFDQAKRRPKKDVQDALRGYLESEHNVSFANGSKHDPLKSVSSRLMSEIKDCKKPKTRRNRGLAHWPNRNDLVACCSLGGGVSKDQKEEGPAGPCVSLR